MPHVVTKLKNRPPWILGFTGLHGKHALEASRAESDYCARGRDNQLVLVDIEDEMYASLLPLPGIHYAIEGSPPAGDYGIDFSSLGTGTVVFNQSMEDVAMLIRARPDGDFLLPERYRAVVAASAAASHDLVTVLPGCFLLLSRRALPAAAGKWSCRL